jgi:hypothetical protein
MPSREPSLTPTTEKASDFTLPGASLAFVLKYNIAKLRYLVKNFLLAT